VAIGVYAITRARGTRSRGRVYWAAWFHGRPTRDRFVPPDAQGEAADEHAARQAAFAAFARARGVTSWREVSKSWAEAALRFREGEPAFERVVRAVEPPREALAELGLPPGADLDRARDAYRRLALERHPDRGGSHASMLALNHAWQEIKRAFGED
jgi:DnaJ-domain-containing protein 1